MFIVDLSISKQDLVVAVDVPGVLCILVFKILY